MSDKTLQKVQEELGVIDLTTNKEEATACRITAKAALKKIITEEDKIREAELKKRANEVATEGDTKATLAYEVLIEHEKGQSNMDLKKGYTTPKSATSEVLTDGDDIHNRIIERIIKYFRSEEFPPGTKLFPSHHNRPPRHAKLL